MSTHPQIIRIAAAIIRDPDGRFLVVRKRGTSAFQQAGGKLEPGESASDAVIREIHEEIGVTVAPHEITLIGHASAPAANERGFVVEATIFTVTTPITTFTLAAEIEEARWIDPHDPGDLTLAPLTRDRILPLITTP